MTPAVSTAIGSIKVWPTEVEVVTTWVVDIYSEVPVACLPIERTVEIGCCTEQIPLPCIEDITQIKVAALPIRAVYIII
jgi:hypothetical protein